MKRRISFLFGISVVLAFIGASQASADAVYYTERLPFLPGDADHPEDANGHVVNIHPNGIVVGAIENYKINGAAPNTDYAVMLNVSADCSEAPVPFRETAILSTNQHGNGHAQFVFTAEELAKFSGMTLGAQWTLEVDGEVAYRTDCATVTID